MAPDTAPAEPVMAANTNRSQLWLCSRHDTDRHDAQGEKVGNRPDPSAVIKRPAWLPAEAKREWNRVVLELSGLGALSRTDRAPLALYCIAWADFVKAVKDWRPVSSSSLAQLRGPAKDLGLGAVARLRLGIEEHTDDEPDELELWLRRHQANPEGG